jgi:branched-chain amino acid transport system permease protein
MSDEGESKPSRIGVDQWVARSGERRDLGTGWRQWLGKADARIGWWPRLWLAALVGLIAGQLLTNVNLQTTAFNALLYAMLSLGLNISVGWAGMLDLGYIAFFGFGAYGYAIFSSTALGTGGSGGVHLPAIESIPIVLCAAGIFGLVIGLMALRVSGDYFAIVTLAVGLSFGEFVNNVDPGTLGGVNGLFGLDNFHSFGSQITSGLGFYYLALVLVVALAAILHLLDTSRTGRAWRAVREDPLAASAMTIPVGKLRVMAYSFGGIVGALAGTLFAAQQATVFPTDFTSTTLILIYACLVLGGLGTISGAILGGMLVTIGEQLLSSPNDAGYLFYGLILIVLVTRIRPWRKLAYVLGGIVGLGFAMHAIVSAISASAVAGAPGSGGFIGSWLGDYVIVPANPATYGNILYVVLIGALIAVVNLHGNARLIAIVPTVYIAACCWESRLIVNPAITTQLMIGAILIVTMAARPQGLLGTARVETVPP